MIRLNATAEKQLYDLPKLIRLRMNKVLVRLKRWPEVSGVKPLTGNLAGHFRMRTGDYRIQFAVVGPDIIIEQIGHRDGFYD